MVKAWHVSTLSVAALGSLGYVLEGNEDQDLWKLLFWISALGNVSLATLLFVEKERSK